MKGFLHFIFDAVLHESLEVFGNVEKMIFIKVGSNLIKFSMKTFSKNAANFQEVFESCSNNQSLDQICK